MGQHTWFLKSKELYLKTEELYQKLDAHEGGEIYLDAVDILSIDYEIDQIRDENEALYHDIFRTSKRNEDGSHLDMVINSREECFEWINNPDNMVWYCSDEDLCRVQLNEFWDKYPNGYITL